MKKLFSLLILISASYILSFSQDTIVTVDNQIITGHIIKIRANRVFVGESKHDFLTDFYIKKGEIDRIKYENGYVRTISLKNEEDLRIERPIAISGGFGLSPKNYGLLYGKVDYFLTPRINLELHSGVCCTVAGINYYFNKADINRRYFTFAGILGGYDYNAYGTEVILIPVGISKIFNNGINMRFSVDNMIILDGLGHDIFAEVALGYRFKL